MSRASAHRRSGCVGSLNDRLKICCGWFPARWVVGIMGFFGTWNVFSLRVNFSVAIVGMVDYEGLKAYEYSVQDKTSMNSVNFTNTSDSNTKTCGEFVGDGDVAGAINSSDKLFLWDENMQGLALGCYFYGYVCSQVLAAWLARRYGYVKVWGFSMLLASMCTILSPALLNVGFGAFVATRVLIGLFSGVSYPMVSGMMSAWAPPGDRAKLMGMQHAGAPLGAFIVFPLGGILTEKVGWPSVFYVTGTIGATWSILLLILIHDSPEEHPRISAKEKRHIESSLEQDRENNTAVEQRQRRVPWFALLTSIRVWSCIIPHFASNFGSAIFVTMLPSYLRTMLNLDIKSSGALSSIPYIVAVCLFFLVGLSADWLVSRGLTTTCVRKIFSSIGHFLPAIALVISGYTGCNTALIMFLFAIPVAVDTFTATGSKLCIVEMAPPFAAIIYSIANSIAMTSGFLAPQIAGVMREAHRDDPILGWRALFWLGSTIYFLGGMTFLVYGSSDVQKWARPTESDSDEKILPVATDAKSTMEDGKLAI